MRNTSKKPHIVLKPNSKLFEEFTNRTAKALKLFNLLEEHASNYDLRHSLPALDLCPMGSVFESGVFIAARDTDLPPSLTLFSLFSFIGAALTQEGFTINLSHNQQITPNPWIICLAASGAGKTFSRSQIAEAIVGPVFSIEELPETITPPYLITYFTNTGLPKEEELELTPEERDHIKFRRCRGVLVRDEVGQWLKEINKASSTLSELKDYLLRAYDGKPLKKGTNIRGEQSTGELGISFYGTAVDEIFFSSLKEEDFVNGLMQRFQIALCHDRPQHRIALYQLSGISEASNKFKEQWFRTLAGPRQYKVTDGAIQLFESWFQKSWKKTPDQESYIRRYAFSAFKYALILRSVTEPDGQIDASTLANALKIVDKHLYDLHLSMSRYTAIDSWHLIYKRILAYVERNPNCTRSNLLQNVRGIGSSKNLNEFLETIADAYAKQDVGARAHALRRGCRKR